MKFLHCFGAGMLFICNLHSLTFLRKSAAIYFPPLLQCKTNTSALEILTEMIRASPRNFFSQPYAVFNVHTCMKKVNGNILFLHAFNSSSFLGLRVKVDKHSMQ